MKKRLLAVLLSLGLLAMTACGAEGNTASEVTDETVATTEETREEEQAEDVEESGAVTFTDSLGREVTVENPQRVAIMIGSFAEIWTIAGGSDVIVATANDAWDTFGLDLPDTVANLGKTRSIDMELLTASDPDFVIASSLTSTGLEMQEYFDTMGWNYAYFQVTDFADYLNMLDVCTQITGNRDAYETYGLALQERINAVTEKAVAKAEEAEEPITVLYLRASGKGVSVIENEGHVLGEMLDAFQIVNIADSNESLLEDLDLETIVAADPDYIMMIQEGSDQEAIDQNVQSLLLDNPAWSTLSAVQNGTYMIMADEYFNQKPNDKWADAYELLYEIIYGE